MSNYVEIIQILDYLQSLTLQQEEVTLTSNQLSLLIEGTRNYFDVLQQVEAAEAFNNNPNTTMQ